MYNVYRITASSVGYPHIVKHTEDILGKDLIQTKLIRVAIVDCRNSAEACHITREKLNISKSTKLLAWRHDEDEGSVPIGPLTKESEVLA